MKRNSFVFATLMAAGMVSMAFADDTKKKTEPKGEKPKASPGWVVIEEDWGNPFFYDFSTALHNARERYRAKEERAAGAEIDKAISWLKYAQESRRQSDGRRSFHGLQRLDGLFGER